MTDLPQPLVPAEVDLRGLPFMPLDVVRLLDSDIFALSTGDEFKAAVALWGRSWLQVPAASLPDDDRILSHLSGAGARWKRVREGAMRGWVKCLDGRWYHPVVAEKALEAWRHRTAQRERAAKRWHPSGNAAAYATASPAAHAAAMQGTVKGQGLKEKAERSRGSRLPPDWSPNEADRDFCAKERPDLDVDATAARFRDYWHGIAGAKGVKVDWPATWRNWVRNEKRLNGSAPAPAAKPSPCGNCRAPLTGGWTNSPKGRVCPRCYDGYMGAGWPESQRAAA